MSSNVELVRSICAAWEGGDYSSTDWAHPDIEWVLADGPAPGRWRGLAGMAAASRDFLSVWEDFRFESEGFQPLDGERVLVLQRFRGRGRTSGMEVGEAGAEAAALFHVRGGKVTRYVGYFDRKRAFAEADLDPEAGAGGS